MPPTVDSLIDPSSALAQFAADVRHDLALEPKRLQPKYLYDDLGSSLFGAICHLPWYRITRAEKRLIADRRNAIASSFGRPVRLIELGCGTGEKIRLLADAFVACAHDAEVRLVDVSQQALDETIALLAPTRLPVVGHRMPYEEGIDVAARRRRPGETMLVLFLGSNIGNFDPPAALELLQRIRDALSPGDRLLLGVDLVKPEAVLRLAYDDPLGVTAAFNKNLLVRMNRELGANFDLSAFRHLVEWNRSQSRVEMHLVSTRRQTVAIRAVDMVVRFEVGESIWTESSYKYEADQVAEVARLAGFEPAETWIDEDARFALGMLVAAA